MSFKKAISRTIGIVIVVVIIIIIGVGAYVALTPPSSTTTPPPTTSSLTSSTSSSTSTCCTTSPTSSATSTSTTSSTTSSVTPTGTLTIDVSTDKGAPGDPMTVQFGPDTGTVQTEVYEGLTVQAFNGQIIPDLATNWTEKTSTDYVFNLRQNVLFQDGTPFNASAVVFTFNRMLNGTGTARYGQVSDIANITAIGNYQVEIKLRNASSDFLRNLALGEGIVSPSAVLKYGSQFGSQYAVGTGPYDFVQWVQNDHITLQANSMYWGPKPTIKTIIIKIVPDASVRALQLQSGQAQLVELNAQEAQRLQTTSGIRVLNGKPNEFITISMNVDPKYTNPALLNPLVREAINYAINRSAIVQYVELGYAQPGVGPIPPAVQDAWNPSLQVYPFGGNISKAKALLAQAGYSSGLSLKILTASFTPDYLQVTEAVAANLQAAGINATIDQESFSTAAGLLLYGNGTWDLAFHDWGGTGTLSAYGMLGEFYNSANIGFFQWNLQHIRDSNLTTMLNELAVANESQIMPLSNSIQSLILAQAYGSILYYPDVLQGSVNSVQNYNIHPNPWYGYVVFDPVIGAATTLSAPGGSGTVVSIIPITLITTLTTGMMVLAAFGAEVSRKFAPIFSSNKLD